MFCRSVSVLNKKDYRWLDMFVFLSLSQFLITNRLSIFCYFKWETICCGKIASKIGFAVWQKKWFNSTINHDNQKTWVTEGLGMPIQITNCDKMAKGIVVSQPFWGWKLLKVCDNASFLIIRAGILQALQSQFSLKTA